jgi:glutaredoxin/glutathione-dependent peroxiredoxin
MKTNDRRGLGLRWGGRPMTIKAGNAIPDGEVFVLGDDGPKGITASSLVAGKKVVMFGVPGAFTRTCSARHLPGFITHADALKAKGIEEIMCLAVNDVFVLDAWGRAHGAAGVITFVSDGALNFTRAAGLETDMSSRGFGPRCRRFSMIVDDGIVTHMHLEEAGGFGETSAEVLLEDL